MMVIINREGSDLPASSNRVSSRFVFPWFRNRRGSVVLLSIDILQRSLSQFLRQGVYLLPPDLFMMNALTLMLLMMIHRTVVDAVVEKLESRPLQMDIINITDLI